MQKYHQRVAAIFSYISYGEEVGAAIKFTTWPCIFIAGQFHGDPPVIFKLNNSARATETRQLERQIFLEDFSNAIIEESIEK